MWAYVEAHSEDDVVRRFPELQVFETPPSWMSDEYATRLKGGTLDIDCPSGLLSDLIAERKGPSTGTG